MADVSYGSSFNFGPTSSPPAVAGVISIEPDGFKATQIEVKALDQGSRWIPFLNGFVNGGQVKIKLNYSKSVFATLLGYVGHALPYYYIFTTPDTSTLKGQANLAELVQPSAPEDDRIELEITLQLTNIAVWAPAA